MTLADPPIRNRKAMMRTAIQIEIVVMTVIAFFFLDQALSEAIAQAASDHRAGNLHKSQPVSRLCK